MKFVNAILIVLICSCSGGNGSDNSTPDSLNNEHTDDLIEFELDDKRLNAVDFNNELSIAVQDAVRVVDNLFVSDSSNIDVNLDNAIFEMEMNLHKLEELEVIGGGEPFKTAVINLLVFYIDEFKGDFNSIVPLIKKKDLNDSESNDLDAYDQSFADNERELSDTINKEQESFAAANNIKLTIE